MTFSLPNPSSLGGLRLASAVAIVAATVLPSAAAFAQSPACNGSLELAVANPRPGDRLPQAPLVIQGRALDRAAAKGSGVDRVYVTLDDRDRGGRLLGTATLGRPGADGFAVPVDLSATSGRHTLAVYAHSAATGREAVVSTAVLVGDGADGGAAGSPTEAASTRSACEPSPTAPVLELDNPHPGDLLEPGKYVLQGRAFDPTAPQGSGIDRVYATLDARDAGGRLLAEARPGAADGRGFRLAVDLGDVSGPHTLCVYAHSAVTGQELMVEAPIVLGSPSRAAAAGQAAGGQVAGGPGGDPAAAAAPPSGSALGSHAAYVGLSNALTTAHAGTMNMISIMSGDPYRWTVK
jgi:hypothetical protein